MEDIDIFLLDWEYHKIGLLERFSSFIWTDRHRSYGDFVLTIPLNYYSNNVFPGRFLHLPQSNRLMIIETTEKTKDSNNQDAVRVEGRSFEAILKERATVMNTAGNSYVTTGTPGDIATRLVREICVNGNGLSQNDVIPRLSVRAPSSSIIGTISVEMPVEPLYKSVKDLIDADGLGMRVLFNPDSRTLEFACVRGRDRTSGSSNPLVLSPDYDNLFNTKFLRSMADFKNVAYVVHDDRRRVISVTKRGLPARTGFSRRVLIVDANDIETPTDAQLRERGYNALAQHNYRVMFDGETPQNLGRAFNLGDRVELRDVDGSSSEIVVVEEIIWTFDNDGWRTYPTLETLD